MRHSVTAHTARATRAARAGLTARAAGSTPARIEAAAPASAAPRAGASAAAPAETVGFNIRLRRRRFRNDETRQHGDRQGKSARQEIKAPGLRMRRDELRRNGMFFHDLSLPVKKTIYNIIQSDI
jgi:hypothetical protein